MPQRYTYLIVPSRTPAYVLQGRMTIAMKDQISEDGGCLFRIDESGVVSKLVMTKHFTEKDPWDFEELPRQAFTAQKSLLD